MLTKASSLQGFVLAVTMIREAVDDLCRYRRDCEMNSRKYHKVTPTGIVQISAVYAIKLKHSSLCILFQ